MDKNRQNDIGPTMDDQQEQPLIRVSAKFLGQFALANKCDRCLWLNLKMQNRMPFQKFTGISMILDSYTKKVVSTHYDQFRRVPKWFKPFGNLEQPIQVPHHSKFFVLDTETNIRLSGAPDVMFKCSDGSYCIIDYKTTRWNENQAQILPMYQVQLNGYAMIAERLGFTPVSKIGLMYFEAQTLSDLPDDFESLLLNDGFKVQFSARYREVELNYQESIQPLLRQVRQLADLKCPPEGSKDCEDCNRLNELVTLLG